MRSGRRRTKKETATQKDDVKSYHVGIIRGKLQQYHIWYKARVRHQQANFQKKHPVLGFSRTCPSFLCASPSCTRPLAIAAVAPLAPLAPPPPPLPLSPATTPPPDTPYSPSRPLPPFSCPSSHLDNASTASACLPCAFLTCPSPCHADQWDSSLASACDRKIKVPTKFCLKI